MKGHINTVLALGICCSGTMAADVVINELAWMGTTNNALDEWIELKNNAPEAIDITGWTLNSNDGTPSITLSGSIPGNGYFLLERTDDSSVPEITADQIYTGSMENGGELMELRDSGNQRIDVAAGWFSGTNETKATMERVNPSRDGDSPNSWATAIASYSGGLGTPAAQNSTYDSGPVAQCNYPDQLEIVSINIGQGDATLIASPQKLLLADAGESYWNSHNDADKVAEVIHSRYGENCNRLDYVVISHLHLDHIGYIQADEDANGDLLDEFGGSYEEGDNILNPSFRAGYAYLVKELGFSIGETVLRDYKNHNPNPDTVDGGSKTYRNWRAYLESPHGRRDFNPVTAQLGSDQIDLGSVNGNPIITNIVLVDGLTPENANNGCDPDTYFGGAQYLLRGIRYNDPPTHRPSENDLSVGFILSLGDFDTYIGGDQSGENDASAFGYRYHDTETCLAQDAQVQQQYGGVLDVLRANHHGSSHSTNQAFVEMFAPILTIFSVGDNNTFGHVNPGVLDRTLATSVGDQSGEVLLTESGADVTQAGDLCHSVNSNWCAEVADGEYPASIETNEIGDDGVVIVVADDGSSFSVQGNTNIPARTYSTH